MNFEITIGHVALDWLERTTSATIQGITSKGLFLNLNSGNIVFLTQQPDLAPLNLIISVEIPDQWKLHQLVSVKLGADSLTLACNDHSLQFTPYQIWQIPPSPGLHINHEELQKRLAMAVTQVQLIKADSGFSPLLSNLLTAESTEIPSHLEKAWRSIQVIKHRLQTGNLTAIIESFKPLFGAGRGLTPSGDDFICGFIFLLNRFPPVSLTGQWLNDLNHNLLTLASQTTNAVSQSLLFCATSGSADQRIQRCADWFMNADVPYDHQPLQLARWGNSSGADFLAGIISAIQFHPMIQERNPL